MVGMLPASVLIVLFLLTSGGRTRAPMTQTEATAKAKVLVTVVAAIGVTIFLFTTRQMIDDPRMAGRMTPFVIIACLLCLPRTLWNTSWRRGATDLVGLVSAVLLIPAVFSYSPLLLSLVLMLTVAAILLRMNRKTIR